jgi:hypothetical protein
MRTRGPAVLAAGACTSALVVAACASAGDGGLDAADGPAPIGDYLAQLPGPAETDEIVTVAYGDLARAAELAGVERPSDHANSDAVVDYIFAVTGTRQDQGEALQAASLVPEAAQIDYSTSDPEGFVEDVGWSILDVDRFAERQLLPQSVTLLEGDFDRGRLDEALGEADDGVWVKGDPSGAIDVEATTPARPLGESLWLALDDERLTVTRSDDEMRAARRAAGGDGTLASDETLSALAGALDGEDVYSAMLVAGDPAGAVGDGSDTRAGREAAEPEGAHCESITGVAAGIAHDGEPLIVYVLAHADDATAERNAAVVEEALASGESPRSGRPWSEMVTVDSVDADGAVVVARLRPADMVLGQWSQPLYDGSFPPC